MQLFLQVFGSKNSTVQEEALMAVGAVANGATATRRPPPSFSPAAAVRVRSTRRQEL